MPKGQNHLHLSVAGHCVLLMNNLISQLGIIIGGYIYDRGNAVREKYGEIVQNPPLYTGHNNSEKGSSMYICSDFS